MITVHSLVRNEERFIWYSLMSVAPFVERVIVFLDSNSTDKTKERLEVIKQRARNVEVYIRKPNQDYSHFGLLRNAQIRMTRTPFFLILDGDEVYTRHGIDELNKAAKSFPRDRNILNVNTIWFAGDRLHVYENWFTRASFTGRLLRTEGAACKGHWPHEMHYYTNGPRREFHAPEIEMYHYTFVQSEEHQKTLHADGAQKLLKGAQIIPFSGPQPEVFNDNCPFDSAR